MQIDYVNLGWIEWAITWTLILVLVLVIVRFWRAGVRAGLTRELEIATQQLADTGTVWTTEEKEKNLQIYRWKNRFLWPLTLLVARGIRRT
jgi:hypothetical protein